MAANDFDEVVLQGTTYLIPKPDANPPWGEELNDLLKALTNAFATLVGVGDIPETAATINNNQSTTVVPGLNFDSALIRSAVIQYQITRSTNLSVLIEEGNLEIFYNSSLPIGQKWTMIRQGGGESEVVLTVNDSGEVLYSSNNMAGTSYTGIIKYQAVALLQV